VFGVVNETQMFGAVLDSRDSKTHVLPNARVASTGLTNDSTKGAVRADLSFRTSCDSDIDVAKQVQQDLLVGDHRVLKEPFQLVFVRGPDQSNLELAAWPFAPISANLGTQKDIAERVKQGFDKAGAVILRPQQEVHPVNVRQ